MTSTCVAFYLILIMVRHDYYMILLGYCIAGIFCQSLISFFCFPNKKGVPSMPRVQNDCSE